MKLDLTKIDRIFDDIPHHLVPGYDCEIRVAGETVYRRAGGFSDLEQSVPVCGQERYWIYSCTKVITCAQILRLRRQGKLRLEDPVSRFLPEYGQVTLENSRLPGRPMQIRDLMCMTSGMSYDLTTDAVQRIRREKLDTRNGVACLAEMPLCFCPGEDYLYGLSHDVLAAVAEVASDKPFHQLLREEIFLPLGMEHTDFSDCDQGSWCLAAQYRVNEEQSGVYSIGRENEFRFSENYHSGGAGLCSTVDDMIRFADALALGDAGILTPENVMLMRQDHLTAQQRAGFHKEWSHLINYSYGLGVRTFLEDRDGNGGTPGEFGWEGAGGSLLLIDPNNRISCFYAQHVRNCLWAKEHIHRDLIRAIYAPYSENIMPK